MLAVMVHVAIDIFKGLWAPAPASGFTLPFKGRLNFSVGTTMLIDRFCIALKSCTNAYVPENVGFHTDKSIKKTLPVPDAIMLCWLIDQMFDSLRTKGFDGSGETWKFI